VGEKRAWSWKKQLRTASLSSPSWDHQDLEEGVDQGNHGGELQGVRGSKGERKGSTRFSVFQEPA